jgi:hypothetical protein
LSASLKKIAIKKNAATHGSKEVNIDIVDFFNEKKFMTICSQIWLNLGMGNTHFGCITKSTKKQGGTGLEVSSRWGIIGGF